MSERIGQKESVDLTIIQDELNEKAYLLGRLFGFDVSIKLANGWATNLKTGEITADQKFFKEEGYSDDMIKYAILHEVMAHYSSVKREPDAIKERIEITEEDQSRALFYNIFEDIAGNRRMHSALRNMTKVAEELYGEKLFPNEDYLKYPRHLQFLYKIIRSEMIPDSETDVLPEVDEAINELRSFGDDNDDVIEYSTRPNEAPRRPMKMADRLLIWQGLILPYYEKLKEQDLEDKQQEKGESNKAEEIDNDFSNVYKEFFEKRHPGGHSHEVIETDSRDGVQCANSGKGEADPDDLSWELLGDYKNHVKSNAEAISQVSKVFEQALSENLAKKRKLGSRAREAGPILHPGGLARSVIDVKSGILRPAAYADYETMRIATGEQIGATDLHFVCDLSFSMNTHGAIDAAREASIIILEGIAAMQRKVLQAEEDFSVALDELDLKTAFWAFGSDTMCVKPLSPNLTNKQREKVFSIMQSPYGSTKTHLPLEAIAKQDKQADRRSIIMVLTDGEADSPDRAKNSIMTLKQKGHEVHAIGLGAAADVSLFAPNGIILRKSSQLPKVVEDFIKRRLV